MHSTSQTNFNNFQCLVLTFLPLPVARGPRPVPGLGADGDANSADGRADGVDPRGRPGGVQRGGGQNGRRGGVSRTPLCESRSFETPGRSARVTRRSRPGRRSGGRRRHEEQLIRDERGHKTSRTRVDISTRFRINDSRRLWGAISSVYVLCCVVRTC